MRPSWSRPAWILLGLLVAYYSFPADLAGGTGGIAVALTVTTAGLALVAAIMVKELAAVRRGHSGRGIRVLTMLLVVLVMTASLTFYLVNKANPDEFDGLETRTDALYFTLTTMSTVGFGDVHAAGQVARVLVCVLIIFNVAVVASLARAYTTRH